MIFTHKYLNEDKKFISQYAIAGIMIIWIHCFSNSKVPVVECLDFLNELRIEKYQLKNWSTFFAMEDEVQDFETNVSIIYGFYSRNETEVLEK